MIIKKNAKLGQLRYVYDSDLLSNQNFLPSSFSLGLLLLFELKDERFQNRLEKLYSGNNLGKFNIAAKQPKLAFIYIFCRNGEKLVVTIHMATCQYMATVSSFNHFNLQGLGIGGRNLKEQRIEKKKLVLRPPFNWGPSSPIHYYIIALKDFSDCFAFFLQSAETMVQEEESCFAES